WACFSSSTPSETLNTRSPSWMASGISMRSPMNRLPLAVEGDVVIAEGTLLALQGMWAARGRQEAPDRAARLSKSMAATDDSARPPTERTCGLILCVDDDFITVFRN